MDKTTDAGQEEMIDPAKPESENALVKRIIDTIKSDKKAHEDAFKRMRKDMHMAMHGADENWTKTDKYRANITGRHVKQKTAALYAKNPKAAAKRRETLDFVVWDEDPQSLLAAFQLVQQGQQMLAMAAEQAQLAGPMIDQFGMPVAPPPPQLPPEVMEAQALLDDFSQGMERRQQTAKIGKTLEILFAQAMREQKPVDFKTGMKQCVRRASTTSVGYVELGFQREYGPRPGLTEQLADARTRLDHLRKLTEDIESGDIETDRAEISELEMSLASLQAEPEIVLREGLIFDFPQSTKVIPDKLCRSLVGFIGARHVTIEYLFTAQEVEELFEGVDLKRNGYRHYSADGTSAEDTGSEHKISEQENTNAKPDGMICVWKHYDKPSGLVYYVADGHPNFLRPPAAPDVFVEDFWPVYALTFNAVESEKELFPPSDVTLLMSMQEEYNRSRQGKREHRRAARPRWVFPQGTFDDPDIAKFTRAEPFEAFALNNLQVGQNIAELLQAVPVPGVDPNLYDTGEIVSDIQLAAGMQESSYGGVAQATATESAIAANSSQSSDQSSIDDLDAFLTCIARAGGQILLREMSEEKVKEVAGPGAVWPQMTLAQIASELFLEVEAGSTGKPNQGIEIQNWKELMPFLIQLPGIAPTWLARETLRRLDDRMDLTEALASGLPSIVAQNANAQPGTGDPATDPMAQGGAGGNNGPQPPGQVGSEPAFGSNQV